MQNIPLHHFISLSLSLPLPVSSRLLLSEIQSELCSTSESKRKISLIWTPADPEDVCASGCACVRVREGGVGGYWYSDFMCEKECVCEYGTSSHSQIKGCFNAIVSFL